MTIKTENICGVHVLRLANGPANILSVATGVAAALGTELAAAQFVPDCRGVVIAGSNAVFCGGADLGDLCRSDQLRSLFAAIELSSVPVVMAMSGAALGGGLELALAGHWRLATQATRFALPEVRLGLLPGLGGTQRLPRLIGADRALEMMLSGREIGTEAALAHGLIDAIVDGDVVNAAIRFVCNVQPPVRPTCNLPPPRDVALAVAARQVHLQRSFNRAPERILECVANISSDFDAGMRLESRWLDDLVASEASGGLRHAFFADRAVRHIPGVAKGEGIKPPITAHVWGQCDFSQKTAAKMRASGVEVSHRDHDECGGTYELIVMVDEVVGLSAQPNSLANAIVAVPRHIVTSPGKRAVGPRTGPQTAAAPIHFHCAGGGSLMEVIRSQHTLPAALATMSALGRAMRKTVIVSGDRDGSIIERLVKAYSAAVGALLATGTAADRIDLALMRWGMAKGPVAAGLVSSSVVGTSINLTFSPEPEVDAGIVELCLLHLINEGARLIDDEVAWRSADIDVAAIEGLGFPRERGGPMFQADWIGLPTVLARLRMLDAQGRLASRPAALIQQLAEANGALAGHDAAKG